MSSSFLSYPFNKYINIGSILVSAMAAVLVYSIAWGIDRSETERFRQEIRADTVQYASTIRAKLEGELNARLHLTYGLAAFRNTDPKHIDTDFALYAKELMNVGLKGVRSLQLAPKGVVTYVFPIEGNEQAIGHDLLGDPERSKAVQKTIDDNIFLVAGPFELIQGGEALVARLPIYEPDADGKEVFWGFATAVLDFAPIIEKSGILAVHDQYLIALRGKDALGAEGAVFYGSGDIFQSDPIVQNITLPYGAWQIAVLPNQGWPSSAPISPWLLGGGSVLAMLTALIVLMMLGMAKNFTERKLADEQIKIAHKRLLDAFESVPTMMALYDAEDRFVLCNQEYKKALHKIEAMLVPGTSFQDISLAAAQRGMIKGYEDRPEEWVRVRTERLHNPGLPVLHELLDGKWVLTADYKVADGSTFINLTDVSAVVEAESALRETEFRFIQSQSFANIGTWDWNIKDGTLYWSEQIMPLFGYEPGSVETTYENFVAAIHPDDREKVTNAVQMCVEDDADYDIEHRVVWTDGTVHWLQEKGATERDEDGTPLRMLGTVWDITNRKANEEALRKLSSAVAQSPIGVFITDINGTIEYVNDKFVDLTGYSIQEAIGQNPRILKSKDTPPETYAKLWETILAGEVWHGEILDRHKDGNSFWVNEIVAPVTDEHGTITHFIAMHEDITERKEAEIGMHSALTQADVANRAKSELMANMSHELRTPLNAIIGFTGAITAETFGPIDNEKYLEYIDHIGSSGQHLLALINDILDVSAIEAGKLELREDDIVVDDLVVSSMQFVQDRASQKQVQLHTNIQEALPILYADARRMKQILLNLLSNAVKFTPDGGTVTLSVSQKHDGGHVFSVTDSGIGMSADGLAKAMVQFGQVDSSLSRKEEGTGLGLPLTMGLVELHGGTFDIVSEKGVGTTVTATFPPERAVSNA